MNSGTSASVALPDRASRGITMSASTRTVAQLALETQPSGHSTVAHLRAERLEGLRGGEQLVNAAISTGRIFVVENEPLVDIGQESPGILKVILYGFPGPTYRLQSSPNLGLDADWHDETSMQLTGPSHEFLWPVDAVMMRFFRIAQ